MEAENKPSKEESLRVSADSTVKSLENAIGKIKSAYENIPMLSQALAYAKWTQKTVNSMPPKAIGAVDDSLTGTVCNAATYWQSNFNDISNLDQNVVTSGLAINVAASSGLYDSINFYIKTYGTEPWAQPLILDLSKIQENQNVRGLVSTKLTALDANIGTEFNRSVEIVDHALAGTRTFSEAAIQMRNVLEHFKGRLYSKSPSTVGVSKGEKWKQMANDLTKNGIGGIEHSTFLSEGLTHDRLHGSLSQLAKNLATSTEANFRVLSTEYIGHIFAVLNLLDPAKA